MPFPEAILSAIRAKPKSVLDADRSFDCINHEALLDKPHTLPSLAKQVKAWLGADIMTKLGNNPQFVEICEMGTRGVISLLLANNAPLGWRQL